MKAGMKNSDETSYPQVTEIEKSVVLFQLAIPIEKNNHLSTGKEQFPDAHQTDAGNRNRTDPQRNVVDNSRFQTLIISSVAEIQCRVSDDK